MATQKDVGDASSFVHIFGSKLPKKTEKRYNGLRVRQLALGCENN